jgi:hypothetical protein
MYKRLKIVADVSTQQTQRQKPWIRVPRFWSVPPLLYQPQLPYLDTKHKAQDFVVVPHESSDRRG